MLLRDVGGGECRWEITYERLSWEIGKVHGFQPDAASSWADLASVMFGKQKRSQNQRKNFTRRLKRIWLAGPQTANLNHSPCLSPDPNPLADPNTNHNLCPIGNPKPTPIAKHIPNSDQNPKPDHTSNPKKSWARKYAEENFTRNVINVTDEVIILSSTSGDPTDCSDADITFDPKCDLRSKARLYTSSDDDDFVPLLKIRK